MPKNTKTEKVVAEVKAPEVAKVETKVEAKPADKKTKAQKAGAVVEKAPEPKVEAKPAVAEPKTATKAASTKEAKKEVKKEESVTETAQEGGKRRVRYFRCIYSDDTFGRFSGYKPKQAAGKALTSILRHREKEGKDLFEEVSFSMIECTRGGNHKVSQYSGKRVKLEKPVTVTIKTADGKKKEINYNFTNKITKVKSEKKAADKKTTKKVAKKAATKKPAAKKTAAKKPAKKTPAKKVAAKKTSTKKAEA
jgi:hypothetical protein